MMQNETKPKVRVKHPDRVSLSPEAVIRLNEWMDALETNARGIKISKNELVSFLILNHAVKLSESETLQLKDQYFDEVRFAEWAVQQLKAAKASGRHLTLSHVMGGAKCPESPMEKTKEKEKKAAD